MEAGDSPQEIIDWLVANDNSSQGGTIGDRQYGVVAFNGSGSESAAYTGSGNFSYAGQRTGTNYSIQGNILLNATVLDNMEAAFLSTSGSLANKLMAAMQGAKIIGADQRCLDDGVSSLSAFLRVTTPDDTNSDYGNLSIDINIGATPDGVDPIDELQVAYDALSSSIIGLDSAYPKISVFPNPANEGLVQIQFEGINNIREIRIINPIGEVISSKVVWSGQNNIRLNVNEFSDGLYIIELIENGRVRAIEKLIVRK